MNKVSNDKDKKMIEEIKELSQIRNDILNTYNSFNYNLDNVNEIAMKTHKELSSYNKK